MSLQERLMADLRDAMRQNDTIRKDAIRMVRAAVQNAEIAWQREASDEDVVQLISQEIKRRAEAIELFRKGGREEVIAVEEAGINVLKQYLPQQLSRDEVKAVVQRIVAETGASGLAQLGPVMRQVMAQLKGKADGRLVNEVVREVLSS